MVSFARRCERRRVYKESRISNHWLVILSVYGLFLLYICIYSVLALSAKWFTGFGTGLEVSAAVNCYIVLKKSKTAVTFTFFYFLFNSALKVAEEFFFNTIHFSYTCSAIILFLTNRRSNRRPIYSKFEISYFKKKN